MKNFAKLCKYLLESMGFEIVEQVGRTLNMCLPECWVYYVGQQNLEEVRYHIQLTLTGKTCSDLL